MGRSPSGSIAARGEWRPERDEGPALNVAAFGEEGGPLVTPGPLIRVSEGTDVIVRVRNTLAERLSIHGLVTRPAAEDAVFTVEPGQTREIRFAAGAPGTYHYWAATTGSALKGIARIEAIQLTEDCVIGTPLPLRQPYQDVNVLMWPGHFAVEHSILREATEQVERRFQAHQSGDQSS